MTDAVKKQSVTARRRLVALLPVLSAATTVAIVSGGQMLRAALLAVMWWLMTLPLLHSLEAGLLAMMTFEPLRGLLRRAQFIFVEYTTTDPIHLLTPVVTLVAFAILLWYRRWRIFYKQPLSATVTVLALIFAVQIFNPFQGGLFVGLSGAMFILVPVAWFYFGQTVQAALMISAMRLVVVMGLLCSLHGLCQLLFGYPDFENYWIQHTDHYESIAVGHVTRALATFNSAEEWGRYVQYGVVAACGFALSAKSWRAMLGWAFAGVALTGMLMVTGQRTGIFGLMAALGTMVLLGARNLRGAAGRLALMVLCGAIVMALARPPSSEDMWSKDRDEKLETMLSHTARGTLQPAKEDSLNARFMIWTRLMTRIIPSRPLGTGLGAGTVAAARYANPEDELYPIDSFIAVLLVGCSLPTALLFVWLLGRAMLMAVRNFKRAGPGTQTAAMRRIAAAMMPMLILNSFFGLTFSIYSAAPIAWLLTGWIGAETARDEAWLRETVGDEFSLATN